MKTTLSQYPSEQDRWVFHALQDGETWEDFGMEQPNPWFSHVESASRWCTVCRRPIALRIGSSGRVEADL